MPKLIDYPRTTYASAWELGEVVDDTGGKCAIDTAARKLNSKVSGSFKAIIGSAVKFGLLTSKRELLSTTTLFRRIKHAYDKQEELLFHREAFLTPPLFTQLCRKFRSRELPVQMLDVMLIREFDVEEINAQAVAKAFTEGARMVGLLDEQNTVADIDQLAAQAPPRRELASPPPAGNAFRAAPPDATATGTASGAAARPAESPATPNRPVAGSSLPPAPAEAPARPVPRATPPGGAPDDAIAQLFGLSATAGTPTPRTAAEAPVSSPAAVPGNRTAPPAATPPPTADISAPGPAAARSNSNNSDSPATGTTAPLADPGRRVYQLQLSGPGMNTTLAIEDADDLNLAQALLEKIRRQLLGAS